MTSRARRAVRVAVAVAAVAGLVAVAVGLWFAVRLTPAGVAQFRVSTPASGVIAVPATYVNAVDVPVEVVATRGDDGPVWVGAARSADAEALLRRGARSVVTELSYLSGSAQLRSMGSGPLADVQQADIWTSTDEGQGRTRLLVAQSDAPTAVVVASGTGQPLRDLTLTLRWRRGTWFFEAILLTLSGGAVAALAIGHLWQRRGGGAAQRGPAPAEPEPSAASAASSARTVSSGTQVTS